MKEFKTLQELIIKAALHDGISTTIGPAPLISDSIISITFSKKGRYSHTNIDIEDKHKDPEEVALYCCKRALCNLLMAPYEEITYPKEDEE
jgi:hypothetical protein